MQLPQIGKAWELQARKKAFTKRYPAFSGYSKHPKMTNAVTVLMTNKGLLDFFITTGDFCLLL